MMNASGNYDPAFCDDLSASYLGLKGVVPPPSNNDRAAYSYLHNLEADNKLDYWLFKLNLF